FTRCDVHHAVYCRYLVGGAFAFHPDTQAVQHCVGIEWQVGWIHVSFSIVQNAKILPTASGATASSPYRCTSALRARQPVQCRGAITAKPKSPMSRTVSGMQRSVSPDR